MTTTAESPEPSAYREVAETLRAPLNSGELFIEKVNRTAKVLDRDIDRRVNDVLKDFPEFRG